MIADYWNLNPVLRKRIQDLHPIQPLYRWRVQGRLNIQQDLEWCSRAHSQEIDQVVVAASAQEAVNQISQGWAANLPGVVSTEWLNNGPIVTQVVNEVTLFSNER